MRHHVRRLCSFALSLSLASLLGASASAQATPGDAEVRFVDSNNVTLPNDYVVMRGSDGSVLTPAVEPDGGYALVGVGRKLSLEFTPKGLKHRSIDLTLVHAPKVFITVRLDEDTGRIKEITQKPYFPFVKPNPKVGKATLGGQQTSQVPPPNNACATPLALGLGATAFDTTEATTDGTANCGGVQVHNDIWYDFTAPATGTATFSTCNTATFDTKIGVYNGLTCPTAASIACNDDGLGCSGFTSLVSAAVIAGNHYLIRVGGFGSSSRGTGTLNVTFSGPPANDNCSGATPAACNSPTVSSNANATLTGDPAFTCKTTVHNSIWFSFVALGATATLETTNSVVPDTVMAIYSGTCGSLTQLFCDDDSSPNGFRSLINASGLTPGNTYYVQISGWGASGNVGSITLDITCLAGPPPGDDCADAIPTSCGTSVTVDNSLYSTDPTDPGYSCNFSGPGVQGVNSVWFTFVATHTSAKLDTNLSVAPDSLIAVYSGTCGSLVELCCSEDEGVGLLSEVCCEGLTPGNTYYVQISGWGASGNVGSITLDITCLAGPPPGDDCADAIPTSCGTSVTVDNSLYSTDPTDPGYSCNFSGPGVQGVNSVWFTFVATHTSAKLDTNLSVAPDSLIAVYSGTCGSLVELCCSEDEGVGLLSEVCCEGLTPGNTYYVQLSSFSAFDVGDYTLRIECPCPAPPPNDDCEDAIALGGLPTSVVVNNSVATDDITVPCGVASGPFKNVWYTVAGTGGTITATTCNGGTIVSDTKISVFCGTCDNLSCVTGNDDLCGGGGPIFASTVSWCSQVGATYYITVGNFSTSTVPGQIQLDVSSAGGVCVPLVQCLPQGSCCLDGGVCVTTTADDCAAQGGDYGGDGTACTTDFMVDGGFEGGTPSATWNEASTNFGTPICDPFACGFGGGTGPRTGNFWSWFGGIPALEIGSVDQNIVIPVGATTLDFFMEIPVSSGNNVDFMRVKIDGITLFTVMEGDAPWAGIGYDPVSIPIGAFADGGVHNIRFESTQTGAPGITNFFVDDISMNVQTVNCTECFTLDFDTDGHGNPIGDKQQLAGGEFDGTGSTYPVNLASLSHHGFVCFGFSPDTAAAYDSDAPPHGQDPDLAVGQGNIMILQTDANLSFCAPGVYCSGNDDEDGGSAQFTFPTPVAPQSVDLIDVDNSGPDEVVTVSLRDTGGRFRIYTVPANWTGDLIDDGGGNPLVAGVRTLDLTTLANQPGFGGADATVVEDPSFDASSVVSIVIDRGSDCPGNEGGSGAIDNLIWCQ